MLHNMGHVSGFWGADLALVSFSGWGVDTVGTALSIVAATMAPVVAGAPEVTNHIRDL